MAKLKLDTRIAIHQGHRAGLGKVLPHRRGAPDWVGTIEEYWRANQDTLTFKNVSEMVEDLSEYDGKGHHFIGGGAAGCFTVVHAC